MIKLYQMKRTPETGEAKRDLMFYGASAFKPEMWKDFVHVADLDCSSHNKAFEIGNIGPEEKITRHGIMENGRIHRMHSVSVGDILVADWTKPVMVDRFGFKVVELPETV